MEQIKAVIFDMDGTIIKSFDTWRSIVASFIGKENVAAFFDLQKKAPGRGMEKTAHILKTTFNLQGSMDEIAQAYEERMHTFFSQSSIPFVDGFENFHRHLVEKNIATGLATDAPSHALNALRKKLNLETFFGNNIYNSCMVNKAFKPDPAVFKHAIETMNVPLQNCVIFEDSHEGVTAAKSLGVFCVGVMRENNNDEIAGADLIINDYRDLTVDFVSARAPKE